MLPGKKIHFHYLTDPFYFPHREQLKSYLLSITKKEGIPVVETINYIFCDDDYLLQLNQDYLQHDTLTDIITFELSAKNQPLLADIYISTERVKENSKQFNTSFTRELHRVIFHGLLHLCGYKDKSASQSRLMRRKEEELLGEYFEGSGRG